MNTIDTTDTATLDRETVAQEFSRVRHNLLDYIRYLVRHPQDAEDILQDVAVVVCSKASNPPSQEQFAAWCRGIARNLVKHYWRKKGRDKLSPWDDFEQIAELIYTEADVRSDELNEQRHHMEHCLSALPSQSRHVLDNHYLGGKKIIAIAQEMGRTAESLRILLMRVRKAVHECVRKQQSLGDAP